MKPKTKILIVEHDPADIELMQYELKKGGINYVSQIVQTAPDYSKALNDFIPDIILCDYSLPSFDGHAAFDIRNDMAADTPFIFVSGYMDEENSIEFIKNGVTDFVLKDNLPTLTNKVRRALKESKATFEKHRADTLLLQSEANLQTIFENTDVGFLLMDTSFNVLAFNAIMIVWSKSTFGTDLSKGINLRDIPNPAKLREFDAMMAIMAGLEQPKYESECEDENGVLYCSQVSCKSVIGEKRKTIGLCLSVTDISARKEAENKIKELNDNLEEKVKERTAELSEANTALEAFSYSVSHDLRAPVRAITSFTQIIQQDYGAEMEPEMKEIFAFIDDSGRRLNIIIDDLLKLAKYSKRKLRGRPVNMEQLITKVWANIGITNPNHAELELAELPEIRADLSMMEQVVINLLSNAIKYSSKKDKPVVTVWCEHTDGKSIFCFGDNGAGFDMKNYDRLFSAFQRLHGMTEFEGTGVGLTLVKNIIEKHGGEIWAEGKVDQGAVFRFSLGNQESKEMALGLTG